MKQNIAQLFTLYFFGANAQLVFDLKLVIVIFEVASSSIFLQIFPYNFS